MVRRAHRQRRKIQQRTFGALTRSNGTHAILAAHSQAGTPTPRAGAGDIDGSDKRPESSAARDV